MLFCFAQVNEAFAPQYLAVAKALGLDPAKTNVNGGAIAIGHPLGASGGRITAHLVHELRSFGLLVTTVVVAFALPKKIQCYWYRVIYVCMLIKLLKL